MTILLPGVRTPPPPAAPAEPEAYGIVIRPAAAPPPVGADDVPTPLPLRQALRGSAGGAR